MGALVSNHIFVETEEGRFANNHISNVLVGDEGFRAAIMMKYVDSLAYSFHKLLTSSRGRVHYSASDFLPSVLTNPNLGHSYEPTMTAFQQAAATQLPLFGWLHEKVPESDTDWRPRQLRMHLTESGRSPQDFSDQRKVPRQE